nr:hypothetical protein [uncultured Rhodopila sp.]
MSDGLCSAIRLCLPLMLLPLFGCGPERNAFAPQCPNVRLIPQLADLNRYAGAGPAHDVTDLIVQARLMKIDGSCATGDDKSMLPAKVVISFSVQRGPAMRGREADVPVFLAITEGDNVLTEQAYPVHVVFPPNVDRLTMSSPEIDMDLPVSPAKTAAAYSVIAGFQLTPDELAANRHASGG